MRSRESIIVHCSALTLLIVCGALCSPNAAASPEAGKQSDLNRENVARFVDDFMSQKMPEFRVPGITFVMVNDGQVLFSAGYGYADMDQKVPVDPASHIFNLASISKAFVATAVMQLAEQGRLSLDGDVNLYLKAFKIPDGGFGPVTFHDLLTHTAGFDDVPNSSTDKPQRYIPLETFMLRRSVPRRIRAPGRVAQYSNYGFDLLGYLVQEISGESFEQYQENHVLKPLGMDHSTFEQILPGHLGRDLVKRYRHDDKDGYQVRRPEYINEMPAGGMCSTATDMAAFMIAHLQNGRWGDTWILDERTAKAMHATHVSPAPGLDGIAYGFFVTHRNGWRILLHDGDGPGMHPRLALIPDAGTGFFFATNGGGGLSLKMRVEFLQAFMDRFFPAATPRPPLQPVSPAASPTNALGGHYRLNIYDHGGLNKFLTTQAGLMVMKVSQKGPGINVAAPLGLGAADFLETKPGLFQQADGSDNFVVFSLNERGRPESMHHRLLDLILTSERLAWYETPLAILTPLVFCLFVFVLTFVSWPARKLIGILRKRPQAAVRGAGTGPMPWLMALLGLAAFGVVTVFGSSGFDPMVSLLPIAAARCLTWLALAFTLATIFACARRERGVPRSFFGKVFAVVQILAGLSFTWEAWYWNWLI